MKPLLYLTTLYVLTDAKHEHIDFKFHRITSFDGTQLEANSWAPKEIDHPLPLVLMGNSWGVPGIEYLWPGYELAERGYIALEYTSRGWYSSGGNITVSGPLDVKDHAEVISWAIANWGDKVNATSIASGGVSYGAGIPLIASAADTRIKAVFPFSGWSSFVDALWWNQAPSRSWAHGLVDGAKKGGRPSEEFLTMMNNLLEYKDINETVEWALERSPITFLEQINERKVAVLMSNQFQDDLFHSNFQLDLWEKLEGPKRLFLNQGNHAEADGEGLIPLLTNRIWERLWAWLDRFLKGIHNDVENGDLVELSLSDHHDPLDPLQPVYTHANYSSWPPRRPEEGYTVVQYGIQSGATFGRMVAGGKGAGTETLAYANKTKMTDGSNKAAAEEPFKQIILNISALNRTTEIAFMSDVFTEETRVCGNVNLTHLVATSNEPRFQLFAFLYSMQEGSDEAALLSHGPQTIWEGATPGVPFTLRPLTFHAACRDVKKGSKLMLGISMHEGSYTIANNGASVRVVLDFEDAVLNVPTVAKQ